MFHLSEASEDEEKPDEAESDNSAKEGTESEVEVKEEETTQAAEVTSEQPRGLGNALLSSC